MGCGTYSTVMNDEITIFHYSFIRLADYLIVNTMHVLAVNSVSTMLNYLKEQLQNTPTLAEIQGLEDADKKEEEEAKEEDKVNKLLSVYEALPRILIIDFLIITVSGRFRKDSISL